MRITSGMVMKNYYKSLESSLERVNDENDKITSERKFDKASDDPVNAMKTLRTYRQLANVDQYQSSIKETGAWVDSTESAVNTVNSILTTAGKTLVALNGGTYSGTDLANQSKSIDNYQTQLITTLNSTFNGQYVFGGKDSGPQPFKMGVDGENDIDDNTTDAGGKLLYNIPNTNKYIEVSKINNSVKGDPDYKYSVNNPAMKYSMPVDVGLGISTDASGNVVNGTAFDASTSALDFVCVNMTSTGCDNVVDSFSALSTQLKGQSTAGIDTVQTMVKTTQDAELKSTVVIGEKSKMLDYMTTKLTNDNANLTTRLSAVADIDVTAEYTKYLVDQQVYNASLSIGTNILQHSLFDFLK